MTARRDDEDDHPFSSDEPRPPSCAKPTRHVGNPDWPHTDLAEPAPCAWSQGHGGDCNADPWAELLETECAQDEAARSTKH